MKEIAITLPGNQTIHPPGGAPEGGLDFLSGVLKNGLTIFMILGVILCVISIVWSGVQWAGSSGDKSKITQARSRIIWSVVGLVIIFTVFFILSMLGYFFNVNIVNR